MASRTRKVTMSDVARQAGVSLKTVSNVVNDWPYVSQQTRELVKAAIQSTGYRQNRIARSLVTGQTQSIGAIIPDVSNPFFGMAIRGCEDRLYENGYSLLLCNSNENIALEKFYMNQLMSRGVDGIILWGAHIGVDELATLDDGQTAMVMVDMQAGANLQRHASVRVDNIGGAMCAVQHLISQGYRSIACLNGPQDRQTSRDRLQGYLRALEQAGLPADPRLVFNSSPSIPGGFQAALKALEVSGVDALFCFNDLMAVGSLVAARKKGKNIPEDLGLVGYDDIDLASLVSPSLTTLRIDQYHLGQLTGDLVLKLLADPDADLDPVTFPVELQIRRSSSRWTTRGVDVDQIMDDLANRMTSKDLVE